jgi:hypothetical protein
VLPNNKTATGFLTKYQEDLATRRDPARAHDARGGALDERRKSGDFDAVALGWQTAIESDPEQIWHSKGGSNFGGLADPSIDALILKGQRELEPARRAAIWHELHRKVYDLQPYLFCYNVPRKFAMNRRIRGFQSVPVTPNYVIRRWYFPRGRRRGTAGPSSAPRAAQGRGQVAAAARMLRYLLRRIAWMVPTFLGITLLVFAAARAAPGNAAT